MAPPTKGGKKLTKEAAIEFRPNHSMDVCWLNLLAGRADLLLLRGKWSMLAAGRQLPRLRLAVDGPENLRRGVAT